jgi:hypothetical protein
MSIIVTVLYDILIDKLYSSIILGLAVLFCLLVECRDPWGVMFERVFLFREGRNLVVNSFPM